MVSRGQKKVNKIHLKLWEKAQEESPLRQVDCEEAKNIIARVAGRDKRTVRKYLEIVQDEGVIEEYLEPLDRYRIKEPETQEVERNDRTARINVRLNDGIKQKAESYGLNYSEILEDALLEHLTDVEDYINELLNTEYSEREIKLIRKFVIHDVFKKGSTMEKEHFNDKKRRNFYKDIFDKEQLDSEDEDRIQELRERSYRLAKELGII